MVYTVSKEGFEGPVLPWKDETLKRLSALIAEADEQFGSGAEGYAKFLGWQTQVLAALESIIDRTHPYYEAFVERCDSGIIFGKEILSRLHSDIEHGHLRKTADMISAEVFAEFLEMAQHLLEQGYKDPAASLAGAVLEDGLRRIARNHEITVKGDDNLNSLRDKCAQRKVFNDLVRKQITAWTALRDSADHGHFDQYTTQQVGSLISDVRGFLAQYLA